MNINEAVNSKRDLLSGEINLLKIIKKIENFKKLRKQEFSLKNKLKAKLKSLKTQLRQIEKELPKAKSDAEEKKEIKVKLLKSEKTLNLESELENIKERLDKLNQ